jgi:hypothetical protein
MVGMVPEKQVINMFIAGEKVKVDGTKYTIELVLMCDLKALMKMLGLKTVFHTSLKWRCPYCAVPKLYDYTRMTHR